jgi:putative RNA 2'-phosphotransferase
MRENIFIGIRLRIMLAKCDEHGYYRGNSCPICGKEGKFLMNDRELESISGMMAGILRHFPDRFGLMMDSRGWVDIREMVESIRKRRPLLQWLRPYHIEALVETDPKGRYQIDGGMVRATYAHTVDVDLSDLPEAEVDELFFPVTEEELDIILEQGIMPTDRNKVHLSGGIEKAMEAGKVRDEKPVILRIDALKARKDGIIIRKAGNDVYTTDEIKAEYLSLVKEVKEVKESNKESEKSENRKSE